MVKARAFDLLAGGGDEKAQEFIPMYVKPLSSKHYSFYLSETVVFDVGFYSPLLEVLKHASEDDVIDIHISSWGGAVDIAVQIVNAMSTTAAEVNTFIESIAHSAGSMIFLAGHNHYVGSNCSMLIHNFSGALYGKGYEMLKQSQHVFKRMERIVRTYYEGFLTEEEINRVIHDQDIWLEDEEIVSRLQNVYEIRKVRSDAEQEKVKTAIKEAFGTSDVTISGSTEFRVAELEAPCDGKVGSELTEDDEQESE